MRFIVVQNGDRWPRASTARSHVRIARRSLIVRGLLLLPRRFACSGAGDAGGAGSRGDRARCDRGRARTIADAHDALTERAERLKHLLRTLRPALRIEVGAPARGSTAAWPGGRRGGDRAGRGGAGRHRGIVPGAGDAAAEVYLPCLPDDQCRPRLPRVRPARTASTSTNTRSMRRIELEGLILDALQNRVMDPEMFDAFAGALSRSAIGQPVWQGGPRPCGSRSRQGRAQAERPDQRCRRGRPRSGPLGADGGSRDPAASTVGKARRQRYAGPAAAHPRLPQAYRQQLKRLGEALGGGPNTPTALETGRRLTLPVVLTPKRKGWLHDRG